jgi:hypothetical protein
MVALGMCCLPGSSFAQGGRHCWELPAGVSLDEAKRQANAFGYWYEVYLTAEDLLKEIEKDAARGSVDQADVEKAVALLRVAVAERPASRIGERTAAGLVNYVPYFQLGVALAHQGDFAAARECVDRDRTIAERAPRLGDQLAAVEAKIADGFERQSFEQLVAGWRTWSGSEIAACLSDDARRRASQIADTASGGAAVEQVRTEFVRGVLAMARDESARLRGRLGEFESAPWASAVSRDALGIRPGACAEPEQGATVDAAERAKGQLESCCRTTEQAMRRAGKAACAELARTRADIQAKQDTARQYAPGSAGVAPALPAGCASAGDWDTWAFGKLWSEIDGLAYPATSQTFQSERVAVVTRLEQLQQGFKDTLEQARGSIVRASGACAGHLQLGESNNTLRSLETRIDNALRDENLAPREDLRNVGQQVVEAWGALQARAEQGVSKLLDQPDRVKAEDQAAFAALPAAWEGFRQDPSQAKLESLCAVASDAREAITRWGQKNLPQLQQRLSASRWLLRAAADRVPPDAADELGCIRERLDALPSRTVSGNVVAWVDRATEATSLAEACLTDYHERHRSWTDRIRRDLGEMTRAVGALPQSGVSSVDDRAAGLQRELSQMGARLSGLEALLQSSDVADEASLREQLGAAGLAVPGGRWEEVRNLGESDLDEGLLAIRDEAVHGSLLDAVEVISRHRPLVDKLGSYVALNDAFKRYAAGDLDGAIASLRSTGDAAARAPDRGAAVRHAALAYFLHTKSMMLGAGEGTEQVVTMLLADAELEVRESLRLQQGFELPALLRRGVAFTEFFARVGSD